MEDERATTNRHHNDHSTVILLTAKTIKTRSKTWIFGFIILLLSFITALFYVIFWNTEIRSSFRNNLGTMNNNTNINNNNITFTQLVITRDHYNDNNSNAKFTELLTTVVRSDDSRNKLNFPKLATMNDSIDNNTSYIIHSDHLDADNLTSHGTTLLDDLSSSHDHHFINSTSIEKSNISAPEHLRIVFLGDSVTRYQYVNLIYYLYTGKWEQNEEFPNLSYVKTFKKWHIYYNSTNAKFDGYESCDCYRGNTPYRTFEARYFQDTIRGNYIIFLYKLGNIPAQGHWEPQSIFSTINYDHTSRKLSNLNNAINIRTYHKQMRYKGNTKKRHFYPKVMIRNDQQQHGRKVQRKQKKNTRRRNINMTTLNLLSGITKQYKKPNWSYDWVDTVKYYISQIRPRPEYVIINAGLWEHDFGTNIEQLKEIQNVCHEWNITTIYKTTSARRIENVSYVVNAYPYEQEACRILDLCYNISWTGNVTEYNYHDHTHFRSIINQKLNEQLLDIIQYNQSITYTYME